LSFRDNLYKEAEEENGMPRALAENARSVGAVTYCMESEQGLKRDTLVLFDIELPADFTPSSTDGEHTGFTLLSSDDVLRLMRETDEFKFNVPLVILDFCVRHGLLTPDDTSEYETLVQRLHSPFPSP
jgi:hypothetical protein